MTRFITLIMFLLAGMLVLSFGGAHATEEINQYYYDLEGYEEVLVPAVAVRVERDTTGGHDYALKMDIVTVQVLKGAYRGQELVIENAQLGNPAYDIVVAEGDKVLLRLEVVDGEIVSSYLEDQYRLGSLYVMLLLFVVIVLIIGRGSGLRTLASLAFTVLLVTQVLVPLSLKGYNPLLVAIGIGALASVLTLTVVGGWNTKSLHASVGTLGGLVVAGIFATAFGRLSGLTGLSSQEAQMLLYVPQGVTYNFQGLLFAGILIGALGAIMDIGMSIASSMHEIKATKPTINRWQLFSSGMSVGRDVMGTMTNTLILAYTGSALPLMMLFVAYEMPLIKVFNMDMISTEIVRALAGSIGLIFAIPITALAAIFFKSNRHKSTSAS